jgi:4-diphosphocytidyl-2-C-methyl-D-erythritol kinase
MSVLFEDARAKVNLTLRVLGRRADGYHDLASLVAFADCADRLTLEPGAELSLTTAGPRAPECGEVADNLVIKAARLLDERVPGLVLGRFSLDKQLPVAAGIGGGSADAAAALRLLARVNGIAIDDPRVIEAARLTGADVPVCLASHSCLMTGVGEQLSPLDFPKFSCVMVNPRIAVATVDVFKALGLKHGEILVGVTDVVRSLAWPKPDAPVADLLKALARGRNDLEAPAIKLQPIVGEVLAALRGTQGVRLARMSGSGATCFAIFDHDDDAREAARQLQLQQPLWWVHAGTLG